MASVHTAVPEAYFDGLMSGVRNNSPEAIAALGGGETTDVSIQVDGQTDLYARMEVDPILFDRWLDPWAVKQALALHYLHTGLSLPHTSRIVPKWITNAGVIDGQVPQDLLAALGNYGELRQGKNSSEQTYNYRWQFEVDYGCVFLALYEASCVLLAIYNDATPSVDYSRWKIYATNPEVGIHRRSSF